MRIDIKHFNNTGYFTENIYAKFENANPSEQNNEYIESITINQIIGIEKYIKKLDGWELTLRTIDIYTLDKSEIHSFNINDTY